MPWDVAAALELQGFLCLWHSLPEFFSFQALMEMDVPSAGPGVSGDAPQHSPWPAAGLPLRKMRGHCASSCSGQACSPTLFSPGYFSCCSGHRNQLWALQMCRQAGEMLHAELHASHSCRALGASCAAAPS